MSWAQVMELALYHPGFGYYSGKPRRIGRSGDFYTAVSVGPLYGKLLGELALEVWRAAGKPKRFTLIEQGAHDGSLMLDMWRALQGSELRESLSLCIVEHREACREVQRATLNEVPSGRVRWVSSLNELENTAGLIVCNELLDAFPVHRVRWHNGQWEEGYITEQHASEPLQWTWSASSLDATNALPRDLPEGHETEVHPAATEWMRQLSESAFHGAVLIADYGYEADEYYTPERANGTLRRYHQHKSDTSLLHHLGESDLTAHINFTAVIEEAERHGRKVKRFLPQGRFLTQTAEPWLRSLEGRVPDPETRALLRQFQTLTHPSHMGAAFRMLLLGERKGVQMS
jgi:SAM-dependent MidA family methyltransferase